MGARDRLRRLTPGLVVAALLLLVAAAASRAGSQLRLLPPVAVRQQNPHATAKPLGMPSFGRLPQGGDVPAGVRYVLIGIAIAVALALAYVLFRLVRWLLRQRFSRHLPTRDRAEEIEPADELEVYRERVRGAVQAGIAELDADDSDPRRAVIACWLRLEAAAAAAGTERRPGDTPGELVERMLAAHRVSRGVLGRLAGLYRDARYGPHDVGAGMRTAAIAALSELREELAAPAAPAPAAAAASPGPATAAGGRTTAPTGVQAGVPAGRPGTVPRRPARPGGRGADR